MEYQFGEHNTNVVDYALLDGGVSTIFLEAKSPGTTLDNHRSQITEYLALDDVDLGILTNGETYEIYRTHISDSERVEQQRVARFELQEFTDHLDVLQSLTKHEVTTGSYKERIQRVVDLENARAALNESRQDLARDVVNVVTDAIGSVAQDPARNHVSDYLDDIETTLHSTADTKTTGSEPDDELEIEMRDDIVIDALRDKPLFPIVDLDKIHGDDDTEVGVYPCDFDRGLSFIYEHDAWGFINIASQPDYFCIYLTRPHQQIQLIGKVKNIISKDEFFTRYSPSRDHDAIGDDKMAVLFDSVHQLSTPIPIGEQSHRMQGLMYTTLRDLRSASTTDSL
jgi:hypothetical protein